MDFYCITNTEAWKNLASEWTDLLNKCTNHSIFQTFEYQFSWWQTRGGGEWDRTKTDLCILIGLEKKNIVGIAPLFTTKNIHGQTEALFIGSKEVSDYLDFIVIPRNHDKFLSSLIEFINNICPIKVNRLNLYNIIDKSYSRTALRKICVNNNLNFIETKLQPAPFVNLPETWEDYLSTLDKKSRHEIRRKIRRWEEENSTAIEIKNDPDSISIITQAFIEMMSQDTDKEKFLTDLMIKHITNTVSVALEKGYLNFPFLSVNGENAAAYLNFLYNNTLYIYNSAWNRKYSHYSPGWVLLSLIIQWAIHHNINEIDFMRGGESYKYKFGGCDRFVYQIIVDLQN